MTHAPEKLRDSITLTDQLGLGSAFVEGDNYETVLRMFGGYFNVRSGITPVRWSGRCFLSSGNCHFSRTWGGDDVCRILDIDRVMSQGESGFRRNAVALGLKRLVAYQPYLHVTDTPISATTV